jgi:hypothetical protein
VDSRKPRKYIYLGLVDWTGVCRVQMCLLGRNWRGSTLEATQGQMDAFCSQLAYKCHQNRVASMGDLLETCPLVTSRVECLLSRKLRWLVLCRDQLVHDAPPLSVGLRVEG